MLRIEHEDQGRKLENTPVRTVYALDSGDEGNSHDGSMRRREANTCLFDNVDESVEFTGEVDVEAEREGKVDGTREREGEVKGGEGPSCGTVFQSSFGESAMSRIKEGFETNQNVYIPYHIYVLH